MDSNEALRDLPSRGEREAGQARGAPGHGLLTLEKKSVVGNKREALANAYCPERKGTGLWNIKTKPRSS